MLRWSLTSLVEPSNLQLEEIYTQNFNLLSANITKWSNTLTKFVGKLPTNCLSVFDHFKGLVLKGLKNTSTSVAEINSLSQKFISVKGSLI